MTESEGMYETSKEKILHDLKRIAIVMRELAESLDQLHEDVTKLIKNG